MAGSYVEVDGVQFLVSKEAAKRISLSPDYVARLARQGKVQGIRSGRTWFVALDSLQRFVAACEHEKATRKQFLKQERDAEQQINQLVYAIERSRSTVRARVRASAQTCGALAIAVLCAALLFEGTPVDTFGSYASVAATAPSQVFEEGSISQTAVPPESTATDVTEVGVMNDLVSTPQVFATMWSVHYSTSTAYVRSWFSDSVSVVWSGGARGVIVPPGNGTGALPVRFTMRAVGQRNGRYE